ncbi:MAG TPA: carbonic anhydrase, partial [Acidobacteriota bacterium]|nr:carbonic anhydrase [Acidobacteriota bacterium]
MQSKTTQAASVKSRYLNRRTFLKLTSGVAMTGIFGANLSSNLVYADALGKAKRDKMTPDEILGALKRGNKNFSKGLRTSRNYLNEQKVTAKGQYPSAVVLSCIDSRAPAEVIMDLGIGDIFNARVAGNIANDDILGSMEFACKLSGAKVVLVMGHTAC